MGLEKVVTVSSRPKIGSPQKAERPDGAQILTALGDLIHEVVAKLSDNELRALMRTCRRKSQELAPQAGQLIESPLYSFLAYDAVLCFAIEERAFRLHMSRFVS